MVPIRFVLGNVCSFVAMVMLLDACSEPKWAYDAVNSVDIGLWYLTGTGVEYKLINAGIPAEQLSALGNKQPFTLYSRFCAMDIIRASDPWCQSRATTTRALVVLALMASIIGFTFGIMATFGIKTPTWDGEGMETTLLVPVVCALIQTLLLVPALVVWYKMTFEYDTTCRSAMNVQDFTCISGGTAHQITIASSAFAFVTYLIWRVSHSYSIAKQRGQIADGFTLATKTDNVDEILSSIANKIDIDALGSDGRNALHWACTLNRTSICHVLLKKGASLSKKDREGWTSLHWASRVGNLDIVRLLAKYGADLNIQDRWGTTPLMLAVVGENRAAVETLIELGANINDRNVFGQTALTICLEGGLHLHQLGMILINAGIDLTLQDAQGMTALHYAASNGNESLFANILQLSEPELVDKKNKFGETLLQLAELRGHPRIPLLLEDWRQGRPMAFERVSDNEGATDTEDSDNDDEDSSDTE
ncbi:hypothetical protein Poli38472_000604 [Pythium oligandrum]|uniref:Uncharacterized protein n=1 Tax=Pythium oligandrum TaxID=41045 RepID=A0A8K1CC84_PYTOL|nr:hypothetical protein Poli38472_000604 [Pythium oligandrum]|eukprot:TMW60562.1 hypothetical protein Poli38472_000604 [Pythium oligandrum]